MAASLGWKHQWPVRPHGHGAVKVFLYPRVLEALDCLDAVVDEYLLVRRTATRSHMVYSVSRSWVTRNTVRPSALRRVRINWSKDAAPIGSSPAVGSSRNRMFASSAKALASAARFTMPPDNEAGYLSPAPAGNPTKPSLLLAKRSARGRARPTCSIKGRATFSKTVSDEYNAPFWNRMPNLRSIRARASHWARSRSRPRYGPRPNAASAARRRYARARISRCLTLPPRQGFPRAARRSRS